MILGDKQQDRVLYSGKNFGRLDALSEKVEKLKKYQLETARDLDALSKSILHRAFAGNL